MRIRSGYRCVHVREIVKCTHTKVMGYGWPDNHLEDWFKLSSNLNT